MMAPEADFPAPADRLRPSSDRVEAFGENLKRIWPDCERKPNVRLGLAVSGGPDSCALLLLGAAAMPGRVEVATVDHGLRPENADEAAMVASVCERLGVPHATLSVSVAPGNVQAAAREARYEALAEWAVARGLAALATAHHADDQAETLMMRLNRASGVAGLAGARERGVVPATRLPLLRPVIDWRRERLASIVEQAGISAVHDPSNEDDRFDRARIRKALAGADWLDVGAIAQSASHLADADAALEWAAGREWAECVSHSGLGFTYRPQAPRAIALRVMTRIVTDLTGEVPRGGAVARVFDAMVRGEPASIGSLVARSGPNGWTFSHAPKRRPAKKVN